MQQQQQRRNEDAPRDDPFAGLQKSAVLKDVKIFSQRDLNPPQCIEVLTKILYLLNHGEVFASEELTEIFFSVTKLFQAKDIHLRRLVYLVIKELNVGSDESLIVVSCLSKDMTSQEPTFRANAIRVLSKIMDPSMVGQIDRFLKQAIVDKNAFVVSSTLIAGYHLYKTNS